MGLASCWWSDSHAVVLVISPPDDILESLKRVGEIPTQVQTEACLASFKMCSDACRCRGEEVRNLGLRGRQSFPNCSIIRPRGLVGLVGGTKFRRRRKKESQSWSQIVHQERSKVTAIVGTKRWSV